MKIQIKMWHDDDMQELFSTETVSNILEAEGALETMARRYQRLLVPMIDDEDHDCKADMPDGACDHPSHQEAPVEA